MTTIRLNSNPLIHAPGLVANVRHSFNIKDTRSAWIILGAWTELPLWAVARISAGSYTTEQDAVVITRADEGTETAEYMALFVPRSKNK